MPTVETSAISRPSKVKRLRPSASAVWIVLICAETTESTSTGMRLNSSKQPHAPVCTRPEKMVPIALKSRPSPQQKTLHCTDIAFDRSLTVSVLPGARGAGGRAAEAVVERLRARHVAAVGERRDDEAAVEALVLVAVVELARALADDVIVVLVAVPVEAQLRLPRELALVEHRVAHELVDDVARVHVDDDERVDALRRLLRAMALRTATIRSLSTCGSCARSSSSHLVALAHAVEDVDRLEGPPDLRAGVDDHADVVA